MPLYALNESPNAAPLVHSLPSGDRIAVRFQFSCFFSLQSSAAASAATPPASVESGSLGASGDLAA